MINGGIFILILYCISNNFACQFTNKDVGIGFFNTLEECTKMGKKLTETSIYVFDCKNTYVLESQYNK